MTSRRKEAQTRVNWYATGCAGTAFATGPTPGTSALLTGIEAKMCYDVARIYGFYPNLQEAGITAAGLVAASGVLKTIAVESSTALPFIGWWIIKPGVAVVACKAVGRVIIEHYENKYREEFGT